MSEMYHVAGCLSKAQFEWLEETRAIAAARGEPLTRIDVVRMLFEIARLEDRADHIRHSLYGKANG
jgi:hypothetical protein